MILPFYRLLTTLAEPLVRSHVARRLRCGKEDLDRLDERFGKPSLARPQGRLVWLHGASVGEGLSLLPLAEHLRQLRPDMNLLITTGTVTSARLLATRLPKGVRHQYAPLDRPAGITRFLDHWQPDLVLWAESEFWPNMICEIGRRNIPLALINGRVSDRSLRRWRWLPFVIGPILRQFSVLLAQSAEDAERLRQLGGTVIEDCGNLKSAAPPLAADPEHLQVLRQAVGDRPLWLAASTHPGEEVQIARASQRIRRHHPELLTVIVPRHAERGIEIAGHLSDLGLSVARRAAGQQPTADSEIYLADTMGELGLFFRLAPVVYMGKTLAIGGGQNPLEPALLDCALVWGPDMTNFRVLAEALETAGAAQTVADEAQLAAQVSRLLSDSAACAAMATAGHQVAARLGSGVLDCIVERIQPLLPTPIMAEEGAEDNHEGP